MKRVVILPLVASLGLLGCASDGDTSGEHDRAVAGAIIGGIVGGVVANNTGKQSSGKAAAGVIAGAAVGGVERMSNDLLRVSVSSEASFDFDKAAIRPEFKPTLDKVAKVLREDASVRIRVVGHTDSVGSESYNLQLSERRARATADYLISQGVSASQVTVEGKGESEPRADNATAAGRAQNRRVEIFLQQVG